ncbi:MAG: phage shock protein operon transcriptional activator [Verrucomicrobiota bacterium JB022]|nr:phage shock protein operon transcriptional activator [Verrucomicrobiota bacterium JB022]
MASPADSTPRDALGESEAFVAFQERLSRVARVDRPVLLIGERGTGKELAVRRLHYLSTRWQQPLVALNCAALSPSVLESELFGHEAGSFTGASRRRLGRFEQAEGGTLFLDEIGLLPMPVQEKILRVVEYGQFERVGSSETIQTDVRVVGATNADLPALADEGKFKRDLLDRLSFDVLFLPPLRERRDDIMLLAHSFANRMAQELGRRGVWEFTDDAVATLLQYPWPGNIRQLKNVVERAVYQSPDPKIEAAEIVFDPFSPEQQASQRVRELEPSAVESPAPSVVKPTTVDRRPLNDRVRELEVEALQRALAECQYHQRKAADQLGLSYHQFRGLYRKYQDELKSEG